MDMTQIKLSAKQTLLNNFAKVAMPVWAGLLWSLIIGALIAVLIVMFVVAWYIWLVLFLPFSILIIIFILHFQLRRAEYYSKVISGEELPNLKWFFAMSKNFGKIWELFKIRVLRCVFETLTIFLPQYVATLFWFDDFEILSKTTENTFNYTKDIFVKIPRLTKRNMFELGVVRLSFFWWNLVVILTFGIANIFVSPYKQLTRTRFMNICLIKSRKKMILKTS